MVWNKSNSRCTLQSRRKVTVSSEGMSSDRFVVENVPSVPPTQPRSSSVIRSRSCRLGREVIAVMQVFEPGPGATFSWTGVSFPAARPAGVF